MKCTLPAAAYNVGSTRRGFLFMSICTALASLARLGCADEAPIPQSTFPQFVAQNRTALAVGLTDVVRKLQSRAAEFRFAGLPLGTEIGFGLERTEESPTIFVTLKADTRSLPESQDPMTCDQSLNLVRYLLAERGTTYYSQKIKDQKIGLDEIDPAVGRQACDGLFLGISVALDRESFGDLSSIRSRLNVCQESVMLEAVVGPSDESDAARCSARLLPQN
jgi:hypothetical protein